MHRKLLSLGTCLLAFACSSEYEEGRTLDDGAGAGGQASESLGGATANATGGTGSGNPAAGGAGQTSTGGHASGGSSTGGSSTGGSGSGGQVGTGGLDLVGEPPATVDAPATTTHYRLLQDTAEFTDYSTENQRFAVVPLRINNFPAGYDYCKAAGGDAELNEKQQWARAELKADLKTWYYDITLKSVPEEDGITPYQLVVDGDVVATFSTPEVGVMGAEDRKIFQHVWKSVPIEAGQTVEIRTRANSNLEIEEAAACRTGPGFPKTYAWARARFSGLVLNASSDIPQ